MPGKLCFQALPHESLTFSLLNINKKAGEVIASKSLYRSLKFVTNTSDIFILMFQKILYKLALYKLILDNVKHNISYQYLVGILHTRNFLILKYKSQLFHSTENFT